MYIWGPILPLVLLFFNHILNCSDRVVFLKNIYFGLFRQCGIFFYYIVDCSDSVLFFFIIFWTVPTVW